MNERLLFGFAKLALGREGRVMFTRKYQSFSVIEDKWIVVNLQDDGAEDSFVKHIRTAHGFTRANEIKHYVWTILHEIGHIRTDDDVEDDPEMRRILELCEEYGGDYEKINEMYYDMPDEWAATEWAIDFVKRHFFLCKML